MRAVDNRQRKLGTAKQRQTEISGKIRRLLQLVANGAMDDDDPDLTEQLQALKSQRNHLGQEVSLLQQSSSGGASAITSERLTRLAEVMRVPSFVRAWRAKCYESNNWDYMKIVKEIS